MQMGKKICQTESEIKQLPLLLIRVLGGIMAAIGLPAVIFIVTRKANTSLPDILPYILTGGAGILIFAASSRALSKNLCDKEYKNPAPKDKNRESVTAWSVLVILAAIFLLFTFFLTR
jgi:zinc transporter ZupT